jgi:Zn-dependent protease
MDLLTFFIVLVGWIFSLCLHEFSHAVVAYYGGDYTVREKGYLTFNPLKYTHPVFSIILPLVFLLLGGIGLPGGAVYIERWRIRDRFWLSAMSLAGPLSNLLVAIVLAVILRAAPVTPSGIWPGLSFLLVLQVSAVFFNLIPLPPFDGYSVIEPFLSPGIRMQVDRFRGAAIWVILLAF